ncbi:TMEM8A [Bugula neritina]|uniref:TMEM8A n=1 Tax=Bugula neritina TaxID=10212 RepID=A0A7J7JEI7_BUGNE|nr:TMEM8A [Bugula neritina]
MLKNEERVLIFALVVASTTYDTIANLAGSTYEVKEPHALREFHDYGDVYFSQFSMPTGTNYAVWTFILLSNPLQSKCQPSNISATVYLQHEGYPIFTPFNESFPQSFDTDSSYFTKVSLDTSGIQGRRVDLFIRSPAAGRWFVAAYADPQFLNKKIRPQGFSAVSCKHFLRVSTTYSTDTSYPQEPVPLSIPRNIIVDDSTKILSYFIERNVYQYNISVVNCKVLSPPDAKCQFSLISKEDMLPSMVNEHHIDCEWDNNTECQLSVSSPAVNHWHYAAITIPDANTSVSLEITILIKAEGCGSGIQTFTWCSVDQYYTDSLATDMLAVNFVQEVPLFTTTEVIIRDDKPYIASFTIESLVHGGGTLKYLLEAADSLPKNGATIYNCISRDRMVIKMEDIKNCSQTANTTMKYTENADMAYHIPYPQSGVWYISVIAECYNPSTNTLIDCTDTMKVYTNITLRRCVNSQCGEYGSCYLYAQGVLYWSVCRCKAGYRGYGCTDDTEAISKSLQKLEMLLLILSNLLFGVAGAVAIYRKWFSEALLYFFVLFASSFYHACDNGTIYAVCVGDYSMLQYFDFYGSILAVWVTAMAISEIPPKLRSFLHMAGVLGILIGTQITLTGLWNFVIPLIIAIAILATSWARLCRRTKACYPKFKIWLTQLLPGILSALIGLALYSFVETNSNYFYVHSIWHLLMATAIIFLLPRTEKLTFSQIKSWFSKLNIKRRRNTIADERAATPTQTVMIVAGTSDETVTNSDEIIPISDDNNEDIRDSQAIII